MIELSNVAAGDKIGRQSQPVEPVKPTQRGADDGRREQQSADVVQAKLDRQKSKPDRQDVSESLEKANRYLARMNQRLNASLSLSIHEGAEKLVIKLTNRDTGEIIRQFPSDELLQLAERLKQASETSQERLVEAVSRDDIAGVLVDLRR